jgi:hypothetical protein
MLQAQHILVPVNKMQNNGYIYAVTVFNTDGKLRTIFFKEL